MLELSLLVCLIIAIICFPPVWRRLASLCQWCAYGMAMLGRLSLALFAGVTKGDDTARLVARIRLLVEERICFGGSPAILLLLMLWVLNLLATCASHPSPYDGVFVVFSCVFLAMIFVLLCLVKELTLRVVENHPFSAIRPAGYLGYVASYPDLVFEPSPPPPKSIA